MADNSWQGNGSYQVQHNHQGYDMKKDQSAWRNDIMPQQGSDGHSRRNIPHDGEEQGKMFVGGLSWESTQDTLQRYFGQYGEVIDCVVMKNSETGRSRGFGFVTFADPSKVDLVLKSGPHELDGRTIDPKACNPRSMQKQKRNGGNWPKVFLGGLPSNLTETDLRNFFSRFGAVMEVVIMFDQEKKKSRGFGFLSFESDDAVERAVAEHFVNINGKQVEIKKAEPRDASKSQDGQDQWGSPPDSQWGMPGMGPPGMAGINNGMGPGNMGPPLGHPLGPHNSQMGGPAAMSTGGMVQSYQGWGTPPAQQGYPPQGYAAAPQAAQYGSWGAGQQIQQWGTPSYGSAGSQQYGSFVAGAPGAPSPSLAAAGGAGASAAKGTDDYSATTWGQYYGGGSGDSGALAAAAAFSQHRAAAAAAGYTPMAPGQQQQPPPHQQDSVW
ncbi:heterogeneous nuclear ribonucleoprotein 27C isoform X2 [Hyalella azteca]|uniref:Heterogeneous nuclear ribonucleoprotein 27C isoform X2 n=1 Tax=Hyalella azteca TaxID=294128 RepID=A0A8B7NXL9_HYAAZ|nr:heterogeneous nuclear ribonucleoprotein 27C isoform X2 [Hyalella azteca]